MYLQKCFRNLRHKEGDFAEAENAAKEVLALLIYPELTGEMNGYVVEVISMFPK
jgi:dTDP-4-amino-4,6-dideoxygalactose transaminase